MGRNTNIEISYRIDKEKDWHRLSGSFDHTIQTFIEQLVLKHNLNVRVPQQIGLSNQIQKFLGKELITIKYSKTEGAFIINFVGGG